MDVQLKQLSARIREVEVDIASTKKSLNASQAVDTSLSVPESISHRLKKIDSHFEDTENRMHRSNLIFFGIPDIALESWADSEKKVLDLCSQHLKLSVAPSQIERAHRLGKYQAQKCRPVIVKFAFYKEKQHIMEKSKLLRHCFHGS